MATQVPSQADTWPRETRQKMQGPLWHPGALGLGLDLVEGPYPRAKPVESQEHSDLRSR